MEQFSLETWLQDKSRKVVTRDGREVRIICTDCKSSALPIIAEIQNPKTNTWFINFFNVDGTTEINKQKQIDLFFADEEEKEELSEFEKELQIIIYEASRWTSEDGSMSTSCLFGDKEIKKISAQIVDLAREEIRKEQQEKLGTLEMPIDVTEPYYIKGKQDALKDLPKWKKSTLPIPDEEYPTGFNGKYFCYKGYCVDYKKLFKTLPKEE